MKQLQLAILLLVSIFSGAEAFAQSVKSFTLTQVRAFPYAANRSGEKTHAQKSVDAIKAMGANHIVLTPEAYMSGRYANEIQPVFMSNNLGTERRNYVNLIRYIHSLGMTVGFRPIILVEASAREEDPEVWHGNIQPNDPQSWFTSLRTYLDFFVGVARAVNRSEMIVTEFTVGAELYSMTVGIEDQWEERPYGFPREWSIIIRDVKEKLARPGDQQVRIMYDINYTDATVNDDGTGASGGELERWRYRLVDLGPGSIHYEASQLNRDAWAQLAELWSLVDVVGIDNYRSLAASNRDYPQDYDRLVEYLTVRAEEHATDIDNTMFDIELATGEFKSVILKEIGYKSCTGCFIDPFVYDDERLEFNGSHQAAAYQAIFNAYQKSRFSWFEGISFWDVSTNPNRAGESDPGFSPVGKSETEAVVRNSWKDWQ